MQNKKPSNYSVKFLSVHSPTVLSLCPTFAVSSREINSNFKRNPVEKFRLADTWKRQTETLEHRTYFISEKFTEIVRILNEYLQKHSRKTAL